MSSGLTRFTLSFTAPLNYWTAWFFSLTIPPAANSGVFEDSCPGGGLGITSLILSSEVPCCLSSRSFWTDFAEFPSVPMAHSPCQNF